MTASAKLNESGHIIIEKGIYKTRKTGMRNEMRGKRGMFGRIPGNLLEDFRECNHFKILENAKRRFLGNFKKILGNVKEGSGECLRRFRGIFKNVGNVQEDSRECSRRFWGTVKKIPENVQ